VLTRDHLAWVLPIPFSQNNSAIISWFYLIFATKISPMTGLKALGINLVSGFPIGIHTRSFAYTSELSKYYLGSIFSSSFSYLSLYYYFFWYLIFHENLIELFSLGSSPSNLSLNHPHASASNLVDVLKLHLG